MLLVIAGAGASFDSVPSRSDLSSSVEEARLPLADGLFSSAPRYQELQARFPEILPVVPKLAGRPEGTTVEDVLAGFVEDVPTYAKRASQLAAVRFYIQSLIAECEDKWYRERPVATNMMRLVDMIERARGSRSHAAFVTFNYDRLIENALERFGQKFHTIDAYVQNGAYTLFKLHGSVDWVRSFRVTRPGEIGGDVVSIANGICEHINKLPAPGPIEKFYATPPSLYKDALALPAIAIPTREKTYFECPDAHLAVLKSQLPDVRTIITIGWRGAEKHFLELLGEHARERINVICVSKGNAEAAAVCANLTPYLPSAHFEPYGPGFTTFMREEKAQRLLNVTW